MNLQYTHEFGIKRFGLTNDNDDFEGFLFYSPPLAVDAHLYSLENESHFALSNLEDYYEGIKNETSDSILSIIAIKTLLENEQIFLKEYFQDDFDEVNSFFKKHITHDIISNYFLSLIYSSHLLEITDANSKRYTKETLKLKELINQFNSKFHLNSRSKNQILKHYIALEQQHTSNIISLPYVINRFGFKIIFENEMKVRSIYVSPKQYVGTQESLQNEKTSINVGSIYSYQYVPLKKSAELPIIFSKVKNFYETYHIGFTQLLILRQTELNVYELIKRYSKQALPQFIYNPAKEEKNLLFFFQDIALRGIQPISDILNQNRNQNYMEHCTTYSFLRNLQFFSLVTTNLISLNHFYNEQKEEDNNDLECMEKTGEMALSFMQYLARINFIPTTIQANRLFLKNHELQRKLEDSTATLLESTHTQNKQLDLIHTLELELKETKKIIQQLENNPEIKRLKQQLTTLQHELQNDTKNFIKEKSELKHQLLLKEQDLQITERKLTEQNDDLKKNINSLSQKINLLNKEKENVNPLVEQNLLDETFESWIAKAEFHLQSVERTEHQRQFLMVIEKYIDIEELRKNTRIHEKMSFTRRFGYVHLEDKPYVVFANGERTELKKLPQESFIANHQFVFVNENGEYLYNFPYYYEESEYDYQIQEFALLESIQTHKNTATIRTINNERITLNIKGAIKYRENQIVAYRKVHGEYQINRFYRKLSITLDSFYEDIDNRGFTPLVYKRSISNGILVYNIAKDEEQFISSLNSDRDIKQFNVEEGQVIIYDFEQEKIMRTFRSHFFRQSSFYPLAEPVTVCLINEETVFVERQNGERIILKDTPLFYNAVIDDVIMVDENGAFLQTQTNYQTRKKTIAERMKQNNKSKVTKEKEDLPPITHNVLILGNPSNEKSYHMQLRKSGFEAVILDGYSPKHKVFSSARNKDFVIVCPDFISHDNMFAVRNDSSITCLFPPSDGAHVIIKEIQDSLLETTQPFS
ncbi:hypothetical protein ABD87_22685 [Lysinibacillus sphaericus]|uniref:hypothetical protein n=1 Tax=Lysinibacillus sphaericus TaxID=1421 RepID=UPI0018CEFA13|nr:hypothetical protein [Lysinibacillus sphaericus]MBG9732234.1 hypothetical protein [Lysinibacillus sphaericus]